MNTERINVENLVVNYEKIKGRTLELARQHGLDPCEPRFQAEVPNVLSLIRAIDPTLLKRVYTRTGKQIGTSQDRLYLYAYFGPPDSNEDYVILYAKE